LAKWPETRILFIEHSRRALMKTETRRTVKRPKKIRKKSQKNSGVNLIKGQVKQEKKLDNKEADDLLEIVTALGYTSSQISRLIYDDTKESWDKGLAKHIILNLNLCNSAIQRILGVKSGLFKK
jgi:hypothetical protein